MLACLIGKQWHIIVLHIEMQPFSFGTMFYAYRPFGLKLLKKTQWNLNDEATALCGWT